VSNARLCRVGSVLLVLAGCSAPQPVEPVPLETVLADWASQTLPLQRLHFEGQIQVEWADERGEHMEQGDLNAWLDGDRSSSWRVTKFGDVYLWYGSTADKTWIFDFVSEPSVLRKGPASRDMDLGTMSIRPAILRMLLGFDPWPADAIVTYEQDVIVIRGHVLGGHLEAMVRPVDLQPLKITVTFPDQDPLVAAHRWTTGEVRVDGARGARRLARVVDLHDDNSKVKLRTSYAETLTGEQMEASGAVFDVERIEAHLQPDVIK
jgi:hypothetical protein